MWTRHAGESRAEPEGMALLAAVIGLALFSLLGLYLALNAATELRISDNEESMFRARYAALAGLNHAREIMAGLNSDDLLKGPDGTNSTSSSYLNLARSFGFRNPFSWDTARSLNILDPTGDLAGIADDGLMNSGRHGSTNGVVLIPLTGIAQLAPNPYGPGYIILSRYFVKVTDNNGEASEVARDPADDPFTDGDGVVIVRSMGIAQTIREFVAGSGQINSVAVFEARFQQRSTFNLGSALVIQGNNISAAFSGDAFGISGGSSAGIYTIDTNASDDIHPDQILRGAAGGGGVITGGGLSGPSIQDVTASVAGNRSLLLNPGYLYNFINNVVPSFADYIFDGNQHWAEGSAPYVGFFDPTQPRDAAGQVPKVTIVKGDLDISGSVRGGGLLVVTGDFSCAGDFTYGGLVLIAGSGIVNIGGSGCGIWGGAYVVQLTNNNGTISFGDAAFSMGGSSSINANANAVKMAVGLMPPFQTSFREITSTIDP